MVNARWLEAMPLFLGMSPEDIGQIARSVHFNIRHHKKGAQIVEAGEACEGVIIVSDGWLETDTYADNRSYHITELVQAPQAIEPDKLFGLSLHYQSSYRAFTPCITIVLPKDALMRLVSEHVIVRINLLNMICRRAQLLERQPWQQRSTDLRQRIALFIKQHCRYPAGKKTLHIKMTQLAEELNDSRLHISRALNSMEQSEKIILRRGVVEVPALQLL